MRRVDLSQSAAASATGDRARSRPQRRHRRQSTAQRRSQRLSAVYRQRTVASRRPGSDAPPSTPRPPAAPPMAPSAAPPGGLLKLPDPTSAAPPQLATPPAAGAPGPVTGLLGQQPTQQVAAADAPQLSPAAAAVLQGINRQQAGGGLLASGSVAGDNAVPTGGPSPAAVAQAGPPHTGAAGAAELAGLLAQQPAAAPPTATPYTNAPPVTGQGAPAPSPCATDVGRRRATALVADAFRCRRTSRTKRAHSRRANSIPGRQRSQSHRHPERERHAG